MTDYARFEDVPDNHYDVILTDCPWLYFGDPSKWAAAGKEYKQMSDADLAAMPVRAKLRKRGVLFMWATCPRLDAGIDLLRAWNLVFRGVPFVWVKTRKDGKIIGAQGVRPTIVKPTTELVLAGSTMRLGRPLPLLDESVVQVVLAPRGKHSEKPLEVRDRIDRLYGFGGRKLEMFARGAATAPGWDRFGDELT